MLYYLFKYLDETFGLTGAGVFQFLSFRAAVAVILSLLISLVFGGRIINLLRKLQVGETVRDLGLKGQKEKQGTPTMGGLIIITAILIPTLLLAKIENIYIILLIVVTIGAAFIGGVDDYIKVFRKNKKGLKGRVKILGQVGLGLIVGAVLFFSNDVLVRIDKKKMDTITGYYEVMEGETERVDEHGIVTNLVDVKAPVTSIPFVKDTNLNYASLLTWLNRNWGKYAWLIYIPFVIFIITAISNGANMTDGLDGLATGVSAIIGATLGLFVYLSGNYITADYLNILYIPKISEVVIFAGAFTGACIGFLWHNAHPASVFMGDTGSLTIGSIIAVLGIIVRKELLLPVLCGIFLVENLSVILQVSYFKYTKKKYGKGRRIFLMSPLHHHYQKKGMAETKIVVRFWITTILLALLTFVTIKLR